MRGGEGERDPSGDGDKGSGGVGPPSNEGSMVPLPVYSGDDSSGSIGEGSLPLIDQGSTPSLVKVVSSTPFSRTVPGVYWSLTVTGL
jgi:hypothetical protein